MMFENSSRFLETAGTVLNYFESYLGRIEIKTTDKVERVYFEIDEDKLEQWEKPQIKESKKAFFYATISDGGDKEKMEVRRFTLHIKCNLYCTIQCFVDFCEDAIFEMQHSASLVETDESEGKIVRSKGPMMPKVERTTHALSPPVWLYKRLVCQEDEPTGIVAPLKEKLSLLVSLLSPGNIAKQVIRIKYRKVKTCRKQLHLLFPDHQDEYNDWAGTGSPHPYVQLLDPLPAARGLSLHPRLLPCPHAGIIRSGGSVCKGCGNSKIQEEKYE